MSRPSGHQGYATSLLARSQPSSEKPASQSPACQRRPSYERRAVSNCHTFTSKQAPYGMENARPWATSLWRRHMRELLPAVWAVPRANAPASSKVHLRTIGDTNAMSKQPGCSILTFPATSEATGNGPWAGKTRFGKSSARGSTRAGIM